MFLFYFLIEKNKRFLYFNREGIIRGNEDAYFNRR